MTQEIVPSEILETPKAIRDTVLKTRPIASATSQIIKKRQPRRIFITGNGTSLYSCIAASYTARWLSRPDDPVVIAIPSGDLRYFTPSLDGDDVIIGISASGEFRDVLAIFDRYRSKNLCIGITQVPGSSLEKLAKITLVAEGGLSHSPVMTKTYASTLTAAHLLLLEILEAPEMIFKDLIVCSERCQSAIQAAQGLMTEIVPQLAHYEHAYHFGGGPAYAAALETALKMKEMALLHAEASETWEMASGPATMVGENSFCLALYTGEAQDESTATVAKHTLEWGAGLVEIGPKALAGNNHAKCWFIPVVTPVHSCFSSLVLVPPAAMLAYCLARNRGANPDQPAWRERYMSQGMTHIAGGAE